MPDYKLPLVPQVFMTLLILCGTWRGSLEIFRVLQQTNKIFGTLWVIENIRTLREQMLTRRMCVVLR